MIEAVNIPFEPCRLEALYSLALLDTPIEDRFERITRLACQLLDMPIASFTLIDESRQWFKSAQGLTDIESPRTIAFCAHTIYEKDALVIEDARNDPRFRDNPFVTGTPYIVFYAGCPVRAANGQPVGTLCVIDRKPRRLSPEQMKLLQSLAAMVEAELQLVDTNKIQQQLLAMLDESDKTTRVDPLTRLWSHAGIIDILDGEWSEAERFNRAVAILDIQIDQFNRLQHIYGYDITDQVLRDAATRFLSMLQSKDTCAHLQEGHFMAVLPMCQADQLPDLAATLLAAVNDRPFRINERAVLSVTASIGGVLALPGQGDLVKDALAAARDARALIQQAGRGRYHIGTLDLMAGRKMPKDMRLCA